MDILIDFIKMYKQKEQVRHGLILYVSSFINI